MQETFVVAEFRRAEDRRQLDTEFCLLFTHTQPISPNPD